MSENHPESGTECEHFKNCVVWPKFSTDSKFFWIKSYCQGPKKDQCARKIQRTQSEFVPDELLPNGTYLSPEGTARSECENFSTCPVWARFNTDSKMIWIKAYCQGPKRNSCARKLWSAEGEPVPDNLLPNGASL